MTIKIGAAYGRCQEMIVGDPTESLEFVLTGTAVDEAAAAEKIAQSGQVVASRELLALADRPEFCPDEAFCVLDGRIPMPNAAPLLDWNSYTGEQFSRFRETTTAFIPSALTERLAYGNTNELAEHRPGDQHVCAV
ncbi:MAG: hypothetical protein IPJ94_30700 [Chloroflexi bacterium]|nr:hypothetical protein [Chloroflexota bacterium]